METLQSYELTSFRVQLKAFAPRYRCRWPARVPGRLCVLLDGTMVERSTRYQVSDVVYKPPEDRPSLRFGELGARTLTVELRDSGVELLRSGGFDVEHPFRLRSSACYWQAERLRAEIVDEDAMTPLVLEGLVLDLFTRSHRSRRFARPPSWLEQVRKRIESDFAKAISLRDYARDAGVHPVHLASSFRRFYRTSVGEHVRALRLRHAMKDLSTTQETIARVALDNGYSDQSHLSRTLKRHTGLTPTQFRATAGREYDRS